MHRNAVTCSGHENSSRVQDAIRATANMENMLKKGTAIVGH